MTIEVKDVSKKYGAQWALKNINFGIDKNEVIGLLGPNGAGKSTLMKCIVGAVSTTEGDVYVKDLKVEDSGFETKKNIGYLPENNPLYLDMYVKEYLNFVAGIRQIDKNTINDVIEKV